MTCKIHTSPRGQAMQEPASTVGYVTAASDEWARSDRPSTRRCFVGLVEFGMRVCGLFPSKDSHRPVVLDDAADWICPGLLRSPK